MNSLLVTLFLNEYELICSHTVKWFRVLQSNANSFICSQLNVWLVVFYSLLTIVGYLMANPFYTYIFDMYDK